MVLYNLTRTMFLCKDVHYSISLSITVLILISFSLIFFLGPPYLEVLFLYILLSLLHLSPLSPILQTPLRTLVPLNFC